MPYNLNEKNLLLNQKLTPGFFKFLNDKFPELIEES